MKLSTKQIKAISLLSEGQKSCDVAKMLELTPQTICEWKKIPEFRAALNSLKWDQLDAARDRLRFYSTGVVDEAYKFLKECENEEVKRKMIIQMLDLLGMTKESGEIFGKGIGSKYASQAHKEIKAEASGGKSDILDDLLPF